MNPGRPVRPPIRIATRGSAQALAQAGLVADGLRASGTECELVVVETHGDRTQVDQVPLHSIGGQGVFTKEVQAAVLDGRADVAVHSAKDLPTETPSGLMIGAFGPRRDPRDALVGRRLDALEPGATIATGSVRRRAQLAEARPDLCFVELRGNIPTRLERIPENGSIVMAVAALDILGRSHEITEILDPAIFVPAVGQGCVAVECRRDDPETVTALAGIDHSPTRWSVTIERAYLARLGSGCSAPVGAHVDDGVLTVFLAGPTGVHRERVALTGDVDADVALAVAAADRARVTAGV